MTAAEKTRLLAERVMGWRVYKKVPEAWLAYDDQGNLVRTFATFDPLTNLAHAGEVLEAMRAKGWHVDMGTVDQGYCFKFAHDDAAYPYVFRSFAPTLPTAICHAALLAEGVKEEELC